MPNVHRAALVLCALVLGTSALAQKHAHNNPAAHQHGLASLQVVVDGSQLSITLDSPLDNLLAFERGPRNDAERAAVRAMARQFHAGDALAVPSPAAACRLQEVTLASDVIAPGLLAQGSAPTTPATAARAGAGHADLQATLIFQCGQPLALRAVALSGLFKAFGRLRQLDAAVVAPGVQRGQKLGPQKPDLAW